MQRSPSSLKPASRKGQNETVVVGLVIMSVFDDIS